MTHFSEEEIITYFKGRLKGERFREVDQHVQTCEECQDTLASVQQLPPDPSDNHS